LTSNSVAHLSGLTALGHLVLYTCSSLTNEGSGAPLPE
jgi:hypothetical protein